jgi:hypothetical protein
MLEMAVGRLALRASQIIKLEFPPDDRQRGFFERAKVSLETYAL